MREILFRGKRKDNGEWVCGDLTQEGYFEDCSIEYFVHYTDQDGLQRDYYKYDVVPETVGQFTGLTDKNGMYLESLESPEDYEGVDFSGLWTVDEVVYGIKIGYPAFDLNKHYWDCNGLSELNESGQYFYEVIGNIHDNPEYLEKE